MLDTLFHNLRSLHRHTALLEMMDWDEEKVQDFLEIISSKLSVYEPPRHYSKLGLQMGVEAASPDQIIDACMIMSEGFVNEDQRDNLRQLLEEEIKDGIQQISSNPALTVDN